ncbi:hypothetical protein DOTSEDRAFT_56848 [Dothistroma septosporum NZE10]|uniref:GA4 desaturase family protein n=1 Tax=Dothistroma septosporum (strain NZE10 / CBS 128990) TaxID=675120 RepID=M2YKH9_DOTSN|nr:hypothetical protein DOTSEDRAFT_56848 [Dothistroma septosporum NZE10]
MAIATIPSEINYYHKQKGSDEYPVQHVGTVATKRLEYTTKPVNVRDVRTCTEDFTVDTSGFQLIEHGIQEDILNEKREVKPEVFEQVQAELRKHTGATHAQVLNHFVRCDSHESAMKQAADLSLDDRARLTVHSPNMAAHVDQSYRGAHQILEVMPEPFHSQLTALSNKGRWGLITLWKPIQQVRREPLAVCDARTVPESDLRTAIASVGRDPPRPGQLKEQKMSKTTDLEEWLIEANPDHQWYWASNMKSSEAWLFKIYDSKLDGTARRTPHCAISTPYDEGPARESCEFRCFVAWEDQAKE